MQPFGKAGMCAAGRRLYHLQQFLSTQPRLEQGVPNHWAREQMLLAGVDALFIVDTGLHVLDANPIGADRLRAGTWMYCFQGNLVIRSTQLHQQLLRAVQSLQKEPRGGCVLGLPSGPQASFAINVSSLPPREADVGDTRPLALIRVREVLRPAIKSDHIQQLFGLTTSESRVVVGLADGSSIEEIARSHRVQSNTVLAHLKKAMGKTGTHRQAELVALVCHLCLAL